METTQHKKNTTDKQKKPQTKKKKTKKQRNRVKRKKTDTMITKELHNRGRVHNVSRKIKM